MVAALGGRSLWRCHWCRSTRAGHQRLSARTVSFCGCGVGFVIGGGFGVRNRRRIGSSLLLRLCPRLEVGGSVVFTVGCGVLTLGLLQG